MSINLLSTEIINQIAAGEVIENPSAVVKELIENSIDANSNFIEIILKNSGFKKIQIKDNGSGIKKEDLLKAPLRHATSKIKNFNDLYNINTMGFRGEALASIFSIAKTKIISKVNSEIDLEYSQESNINSYEISSENIKEVKVSSCDGGTTIIVEDLFYNTPTRKKYLKSENQELKSIIDIINRFLISYNEIKFVVKHNNKMLVNKPIFKSELENLYYIFGNDLKENLLEINNEIKGIHIKGYIGKPSNITYPVRKNQNLFVNNRFVKSKLIKDAIYEGFGTNLMEGRHPFYCVFIQIDPEIIDVNVHPTKIEIRFENELEIYDFVRSSIQKIFEKEETFKPFEKEEMKIEKDFTLNEKITNFDIQKNKMLKKKEPKNYFSKETQQILNEKEIQVVEDNFKKIEKSENIENKYNIKEEEEEYKKKKNLEMKKYDEENNNYGPLYTRLKNYRIVGQINKTFIILETPSEMIIVDQHVAEEKFYYEKFKQEIENKSVQSQNLLKSEIIKFTNSEMILYTENLGLLEKLGFKTEEFGENEIVVRAVPIGIKNRIISSDVIKDIIYEITVDKKFKLLENEKIEKLASIACKKSIKAGHELTNIEIHKMIEDLKKLKEPFNCPHGRPILLNWNFTELEKKFKRIV